MCNQAEVNGPTELIDSLRCPRSEDIDKLRGFLLDKRVSLTGVDFCATQGHAPNVGRL